MLYKLNWLVNRACAERVTGLHRKFNEPTPVQRREALALALSSWKTDLQELAAMKTRPERETVMASLKKLISGLNADLKMMVEMLDLTNPGNVLMLR